MTPKRVTALLLVALLLVSAVGGIASVAAAGPSDGVDMSSADGQAINETEATNETTADEAYVTEDGDVVLVYDYDDSTGDSSITSGHAGVDVSEGLAHVRIDGEEVDTNTTGEVTMWASPDEVAANGTLSTPQPDWLTSLDTDIESVSNDTENHGSMTVDAAMALDGDASLLAIVQEAGTSGFVETTPTSLESNGSAGVELSLGVGADRSHDVVLTESDGSYTLDVKESYVLQSRSSEDPTDGWDSREAARETLRNEFCAGDGPESVSCSVTIENYALSDDGRLDLSYTVTYDGLDATISEAIVQGLTTSRTNVSEAQASDLAGHIDNVTLSRVEAQLVSEGGETNVRWNVSLDGRDDLTLAYAGFLELLGQVSSERAGMPGGPEMTFGGPFGSSPRELAEQLQTQVAASRAADLQQSTQWNLTFTTSGSTAQMNGTVESETSNWANYVDELEARNGTVPAATAASLEIGTTGDRVEVDGSATVADDDLLQSMLESYNESLSQYGAETTRLTETIDAVEAAEFTRARMDLSVDDRVTYEGAVAVDNATALSSRLPEPLSSIDGSYTNLEEGETIVRLEDAVASDADASAVRELTLVGPETDVTLAGEWDRSFDSLDTDYVEQYLGLQSNGNGSNDLPVVVLAGGGLAVTAAAGGGIVLFRQFG